MDLAEKIYALAQPFPREEIYGLTSQTRRAASSIPANNEEGNGRNAKMNIFTISRTLWAHYAKLRHSCC